MIELLFAHQIQSIMSNQKSTLHKPVCLSVSLSLCLSLCFSVCLSVSLSVDLPWHHLCPAADGAEQERCQRGVKAVAVRTAEVCEPSCGLACWVAYMAQRSCECGASVSDVRSNPCALHHRHHQQQPPEVVARTQQRVQPAARSETAAAGARPAASPCPRSPASAHQRVHKCFRGCKVFW